MAEYKYIDKTELMGKIYENPAVEHNMRCVQLLSAIRTVPTYDAVEIVRCKDCNRSEKRNGDRYCKYWFDTVDPFHYCSKGERKKENA